MKLLEFFCSVFYNIRSIVRSKNKALDKVILFFIFLRLSCKYFFVKILIKTNIKYEKMLGYKISSFDYEIFYALFNNIFIGDEYAFQTDKENPLIIDCGSNIGMSVIYFKKNIQIQELFVLNLT